MEILRLAAVGLAAAMLLSSEPVRLRVSENGRYLQKTTGEPFFYLADTAWELFHRLDRGDAQAYLRNRAQKGFTAVQAVVLAELNGLDEPNAYGELPLIDRDPSRPNEAYFRHVDYIVEAAEREGLFIAMLPTWGKYWGWPGTGKDVVFNADNARAYGRWLGKRYRDRQIIWVLGGDKTILNDDERRIVYAMAEGLEEGDGGLLLKTYHPRGPGQSSIHLHNAKWLDFNMSQSSHAARDHDNGLYAEHDYALKPAKPTIDGEPRYEGLAVGFYLKDHGRVDRFDDFDVRQAAYWSLLAGAAGHTYGHASIWQMWEPGRDSIIFAQIPWRESLDHPGAFQMQHVRTLFEARPFSKLVPDAAFVRNGPLAGPARLRSARAADGSFAIVYSPRGESFTLDKSVIRAERVRETWFDPRYGTAYEILVSDRHGFQTYTPPTSGRGQDWVLLLEDADAGLPPLASRWTSVEFRTPQGDSWAFEPGGVMKALPNPRITEDLISRENYRNFEMEFEFRHGKDANSGVKYRIQDLVFLDNDRLRATQPFEAKVEQEIRTRASKREATKGPAQEYVVGFEYQIFDGAPPSGSLYGMVPAAQNASKPLGEWNKARIVVRGNSAEHYLNGTLVMQADLDSKAALEGVAKRWGLDSAVYRMLSTQPRRFGPVSLQNHGTEAWFRNVRIRRL